MSEQPTDGAEQTDPTELARNAAILAEAAAEHAATAAEAAERHRDAAYERAAAAEQAYDRDLLLEAADQASAAAAEATRAKRAQADAAAHLRFAQQHHDAEAAPDSPTGKAVTRAADAVEAARQATDDADRRAREAGKGIDWLRYHLDGHCTHWKQRAGI
jgi:hypothetical protein